MSQGSSAQVYKHNTVCPGCSQTDFLRKVTELASDKKKDILAAGTRGIGRQTTHSHASMTRWFLLGIKKSNMLRDCLSYTFLQPRNCLIKLLLCTCTEMIWDIIKRLT